MLQLARADTTIQEDVVAFRVADQDFGIDIGYVREIRGWSQATLLPHAPAYVTGVINLRGSVVAVVDLSARLGLGQTKPTPRHVIIIVQHKGKLVGILADLVCDIVGINDDMLHHIPDLIANGPLGCIMNVITLPDGTMLRKLDLDAVFQPEGGR